MEQEQKKKKKFTAPHTFVILVCMMILAIIATHFVPAGSFERFKDEATGKTLVQAGSYHYIDPSPVSIFSLPGIICRASSTVRSWMRRILWRSLS